MTTVTEFRDQVLALSSRLLTPSAVDGVLAPTLDDVLAGGRFEVISIGFVIALWSGSRALNVVVDTVTIMYGLAGQRGILRTRVISFALYLGFLLAAVIFLPLVLAGPGLVARILPDRLSIIGDLYWPVVLLGSVCMLATLYHLAVPLRTRWRADLPGAALTLLMWLGGSYLLRVVLGLSIGSAIDLRAAGRADRGADLALPAVGGHTDRGRLQRQPGRALPPAVRSGAPAPGRGGRRGNTGSPAPLAAYPPPAPPSVSINGRASQMVRM